jgi:hypothetical protein
MLPVSLGWPPPCAWKMVAEVVRMRAVLFSEGLKSDWVVGGNEESGVREVMGEVWVCSSLSF